MRKSIQVGLLLFFLIPAKSKSAAMVSFVAEPQAITNSGIGMVGTFGSIYNALPNQTISAELDFNEEDMTVTFRRVLFDIERRSFEMSLPFFGSGGIVTISGTIEIEANLEFFSDQAISLVPISGETNQFRIDRFARSLRTPNQPQLIGNYEFSGPNETIRGTFDESDESFSWYQWNRPIIIDTTDFPNGVTIMGNPRWRTFDNFKLIDQMIDGISILVWLGWADFQAPANWEFTVVPEPPEYALMIGGLLIAFIAFRRRGFLKSG